LISHYSGWYCDRFVVGRRNKANATAAMMTKNAVMACNPTHPVPLVFALPLALTDVAPASSSSDLGAVVTALLTVLDDDDEDDRRLRVDDDGVDAAAAPATAPTPPVVAAETAASFAFADVAVLRIAAALRIRAGPGTTPFDDVVLAAVGPQQLPASRTTIKKTVAVDIAAGEAAARAGADRGVVVVACLLVTVD
jgi:hypothetical protein